MNKAVRNQIDAVIGALTGKQAAAGLNGPAQQPVAPSRKGLKGFTTWQDEAAVKQFKALAVELGVPVQKLQAEAMNMVFAKYRKPPIA
jgi:hypothetical protein